MKRLFLFLLFCLCEPAFAQVFDSPQNTKVLIAGVLEWKADLASFSKKNRKDKELQEFFLKQGVPASNISALYDREATLKNMNEVLSKMAEEADASTTLIFYYAGHGLTHNGAIYFANYDILPSKPVSTGFDLNQLSEQMAKSKARNIVLMADCCYSGGLLEQAKKMAGNKKKVLCLSSATASNLSTGNWTFSQTLLDCFRGEAIGDKNQDKTITVAELRQELSDAMKFRERQMSGFAVHGFSENRKIAAVTKAVKHTAETGTYQWAKYEKGWSPVRILNNTEKESFCEFYFYSDKLNKTISAKELRPIYFVRHQKGDKVLVEWKKQWYKATVLKTEGDFAYIKYDNYEDSWNEWVLYDRIRTGKEKKVQVLDAGAYYPAEILEEKNGLFYIHYDNYASFWDLWVGEDRIKR